MPSDIEQKRLRMRRIHRKDWGWINEWFEDEWLNLELGPMDREWLEFVLNAKDGVQLVAEFKEQPVGLVGVTWASIENPFHVITDLAVAPKLRGNGIGALVLAGALRWPSHPPTHEWRTFVAKRNLVPMQLLRSMAWQEDGELNGMLQFKYTVR